MISSLVVEGHGHGLGPHHAPPPGGGNLTFVSPFFFDKPPPPPREFLRPLPVPNRYPAPNGCRVVPTTTVPRVSTSLPPLKPEPTPVNLTKEAEEMPMFSMPDPRLYPPYFGPYGSLYPRPYPPMSMPYQPPYSPPKPPEPSFKVPSGKEGSLKHRLLARKRAASPNFTKGSLIKLASGELRKVEDMRTEDFVSSAEQSAELRLDPSTVVRIEDVAGAAAVTLSHGEHRTEVRLELSVEHPFFVYGKGWASCSPERSLLRYGLNCQRLQVGDICVSLTPRSNEPQSTSISHSHKKRRWSAPEPDRAPRRIKD